MTAGRTVDLLVPDGLDDPVRPSGGNTYDRRVAAGLRAAGWSVRLHPATSARGTLGALPDGALVVVDGLAARRVAELLLAGSRRLRLVVLLHMPAGEPPDPDREGAVLRAATAVVTTSRWCRSRVVEAHGLDPARVHVAEPGVDLADPATGSADGGNLLCVAAVTPGKGHDVLLAALTEVADLQWRCSCVGALTRAPGLVADLRRRAGAAGLSPRVVLAGPRVGAELAASYAAADTLVLASRAESYGMVVTEALARGLPVLATDAGGIPEALGRAPDGTRPGLLVPAGDAGALAGALRRWLTEPDLRAGLRAAARRRRAGLAGWDRTTDRVAHALARAADGGGAT